MIILSFSHADGFLTASGEINSCVGTKKVLRPDEKIEVGHGSGFSRKKKI